MNFQLAPTEVSGNNAHTAAAQPTHKIILVSDGTGETAQQFTKAAMVQFSQYEPLYIRYTNIRNEKQIDAILDEAEKHKALIVFTLVSQNLRNYLTQKSRQKSLLSIDLLGPLLSGLGSYFGYEPKMVAGLLHDVNEQYFLRIEAMEYTIAHDDGRDFNGLEEADLIIVGISRTSKTPLSMYLSTQGWKVANIPIISGFELPKELFQADQKKIIGLTIDAEDLAKIRRARLQKLGQHQGGDYASLDRIQAELDYANEIYRKNRRWPTFNVTGKALEETAAEIIRLMSSRKVSSDKKVKEKE